MKNIFKTIKNSKVDVNMNRKPPKIDRAIKGIFEIEATIHIDYVKDIREINYKTILKMKS